MRIATRAGITVADVDPLLADALHHLGVRDRPRPLTEDHDNAWRAGQWKIKTAVPAERPGRPVPARGGRRRTPPLGGLYPVDGAHGQSGNGVWNAIGWLPGHTLWQVFAPARGGHLPADHAGRLLDIANTAFAEPRRLHAVGWRHGDVTPFKTLVTANDEVVSIDWDRAHHRDLLPLPLPYRAAWTTPPPPRSPASSPTPHRIPTST
ncbi:hypothetical protein [Embleya sp. NPDC001921]